MIVLTAYLSSSYLVFSFFYAFITFIFPLTLLSFSMFCLVHDNTDELRMAVKEAICENERDHKLYEEAIIAVTVDEPLQRYVLETLTENDDVEVFLNLYLMLLLNVLFCSYCKRIVQPDFWGGESELLVNAFFIFLNHSRPLSSKE